LIELCATAQATIAPTTKTTKKMLVPRILDWKEERVMREFSESFACQ
jgi:hypothetical protein